MNLAEWRNAEGNIAKAGRILESMEKTGLWGALIEDTPKGHLPIGSSTEDVCRALGEITGYNQCLLNLKLARRPEPQREESLEVGFGG